MKYNFISILPFTLHIVTCTIDYVRYEIKFFLNRLYALSKWYQENEKSIQNFTNTNIFCWRKSVERGISPQPILSGGKRKDRQAKDYQSTKGYQSTNENEGLISLNLFEVLNIPYHPMGKIISFIPVALPVKWKEQSKGKNNSKIQRIFYEGFIFCYSAINNPVGGEEVWFVFVVLTPF